MGASAFVCVRALSSASVRIHSRPCVSFASVRIRPRPCVRVSLCFFRAKRPDALSALSLVQGPSRCTIGF